MAKRTKSQSKKTKRQSIPRSTRKFQLRKDHAVDQHVAEILDFKRAKRAEVTTIRDGVRLIWALENNDLSVLFEMFPHLKLQVNGGGGGDNSIAAALELFMAELKQNQGYVMQSALPAPKKPLIAAPPKAEVKQSVALSADEISSNFLNFSFD
jgi:hypothetical protein